MVYQQVEIEANSKSLYLLNDNSSTKNSNMKASGVPEAIQITSRWSALDESEDVDATKPTEQSNDVVEYSRVRLLSQPTPRWDVQISDSALSISSDGLEIKSHMLNERERSGQNGTTAYSSRLAPTWNKTQCLCYSEVEILNEVGEGYVDLPFPFMTTRSMLTQSTGLPSALALANLWFQLMASGTKM